ncbi:MAG: NAD(P)/FAD-dependent oxidoreductase [Methanosarcinales archaeon Met12]|nr:MAG: NAD(P)/FAD-dependent oxidoreductase [Methanosarcinales archaeon Met12]
MKKYDAIIVGAGISGLLTALAISKSNGGKNVLMLEKEDYIGGACRSYNVDGYTVDTGPHIITQLNDGPLRELMTRYFDVVPVFKPHGKYYVKINGSTKEFPWTVTDWIQFDVLPLRDRILIIQALFSALNASLITPKKLAGVSVYDYIKNYNFSESTLRFIDTMAHFLTGTSMYETSVFRIFDWSDTKGMQKKVTGLVNFLFKEGARDQAYPIGGIGSIIDAIVSSFPDGRVDIKKNVEVKRIIIENDSVKGVSDGENEYYSDLVVYSGFVSEFPKILDDGAIATEYADKLSNITNVLALTIWLGLKKKYLKNVGSEILVGNSSCTGAWAISVTNYDKNLAPPEGQLIGFLFKIGDKDIESTKKRAMEFICKYYPSIEKDIEMIHYQVMIPEKSVNKTNQIVPSHRTPIRGLYLVGTDTSKKSMGITRASYSVVECLTVLEDDGLLC